jgi:hypothetical protein
MLKKENSNFEKYVELRTKIRDSHYLQWELLNETILDLIQKTEDVTPEIIDDIKKAYDFLSQGIILSMFPTDFPPPKTFDELQEMELPLLEKIPQAIKKMFNRLYRAFLKTSINNYLMPEESLHNLQMKFNNENAEIRYSNNQTNPYLNPKYTKMKGSYYDWRKKTCDEYYLYYDETINLISSIRNFETHRDDAFASAQFDLAKRRMVEPISGIESPGNYLVLSSLVILSVYTFIEILQLWLDTQTRIGKT